jgi:hypothetical protein
MDTLPRTDHVLMKMSHAANTRNQASNPPFGGAGVEIPGLFSVGAGNTLEALGGPPLLSLMRLMLNCVKSRSVVKWYDLDQTSSSTSNRWAGSLFVKGRLLLPVMLRTLRRT